MSGRINLMLKGLLVFAATFAVLRIIIHHNEEKLEIRKECYDDPLLPW